MLSVSDAIKIVKLNLPNCAIKKYIIYKDMFVFLVYTNDKIEGEYDPFYSVNRTTSKFEGFALFAPGVFNEVMDLFDNAKTI